MEHTLQKKELAALAEDHYLRERTHPEAGDTLYLHLSDLLSALRQHTTDARIKILDLGCGGSPYRFLFPNADYRRADVQGMPDLDFQIDAAGRTDAPSEEFDIVLSTQVLEHCRDPSIYLSECWRVLRKSGTLLLSTHGLFEDHSCPDDFHRWTADGLAKDVARAGFDVKTVKKLTTEGRALALLLRSKLHLLAGQKRDGFGIVFRIGNRMLNRAAPAFDAWCDARLSRFRVVDSGEPGHTIYIALLAIAHKPAAGTP